MYIGSKKVKEYIKGVVTFEDDSTYEIQKDLYEKMLQEEKGDGGVLDVIRAVVSKDILALLSHYDLDWQALDNILMGVSNLASNAREDAIAKKFNCNGLHSIKLKDILGE